MDPGTAPVARKTRTEYAGAAYAVMALGNQGRDIYADERVTGSEQSYSTMQHESRIRSWAEGARNGTAVQ